MVTPTNSSSSDKSDTSSAESVNREIATNEANTVSESSANAPNEDRQPTKLESFFAITKSLILRALIIYFITSFFRRPAAPATTDATTGEAIKSVAAQNLFPNGTRMSLYVYISEQEDFKDFANTNELFWMKENLIYGDWTSGTDQDGSYTYKKHIPITAHLKNNGSLFLHAYLTRLGDNPDPSSQFYAKQQMSYVKRQLNRFKLQKSSTTKNLLTGESDVAVNATGTIVSHWHPNMTLNVVVDHTFWSVGAVPAPMNEYIYFTDDGTFYRPVLFANDFWNMAKDYQPLNDTFELHLTFQPLSLFKWQLYAAQNMRAKWNLLGDTSESDEDQDTLKETLLDTSPYLLGITVAVSLLHSVFELLAFKNDIQFWNNRSSLEGLSVRSVFFGVFQSLIVLLYVLDNDTNTLVKVSCFVGLGIELWKIQKVVDVKFENGRLRFQDKGSYVQSSTKMYDQLAFRYLSWGCFPLLVAYGVYALLYLEHKGWYSFVLDLLYGFLLTFGFIMMTPQLFINYKLKSVAHLPWRMLTYKFLNTFIDDMFAFVIKMPTLYRIGCFRDDIVFLVFVYQRWIYRVDKTRVNEFGFSGEQVQPEQKAIEDKKTQ